MRLPIKIAVLAAVLTWVGACGAMAAETLTLNQALAEAYLKNPDLEAARAELRGVDEDYEQALAGFRPSVDGTASYTSTHRSASHSDPKALALEVTQSLYSGGSTVAAVDESYSQIKAARAQLQAVEQTVLLDVVTAYMNLIRDQEIVELRQNNEKVLESHLKASRERFELGDITKTDVSQAQSRFAKATASRISAAGELKRSRAFFEKVVGLPPQELKKPDTKFNLPATEEEALQWAERKSPSLAYAKHTEDAARASTRSVMGENLPQVDLAGTVTKTFDPASLAADSDTTRSVGVTLTVPLYAGGATLSRIRQSKQQENQARLEKESAARSLRRSVIDAREKLSAAEAESKALQSQIEAAKLALDGVKVEADYGSRTTLDLLDAEQEYLDAQVAHVGAETTRIIATYGLLAALGDLTAASLRLDVPVYNAEENFQKLSGPGFVWPFHGDK